MTIDRDPAECVHATISLDGSGRLSVRLTRADGVHVPPILCASAAQAAALVRAMNPANADALLAALEAQDASSGQAQALDLLTSFVEGLVSGLKVDTLH